MKTSGHSSLENYTSHFIWKDPKGLPRFYCVRGELETEQNCNILTPTLMAITAFLPVLLGCSTGGLGPSLSGTWSSFQHLLSNFNCSIGVPEGPLCWLLALSTACYLQLMWTSCRRSYIIIWRPLFFLWASQFRTQFNPSTVNVISWYSSTWCTCYLHRCICYFDSLAGSEVNMQYIDIKIVEEQYWYYSTHSSRIRWSFPLGMIFRK